MNKYFAAGKLDDDTQVTVHVTDLSTFINASPEDLIIVESDEGYHEVRKGTVEWQGIQCVQPLT